jgi:WD40 repeat protein
MKIEVRPDQLAKVTVSVDRQNHPGRIQLEIPWLPASVYADDGLPITIVGNSIPLTFTVHKGAISRSYTIRLVARSGNLMRTCDLTLNVIAPPREEPTPTAAPTVTNEVYKIEAHNSEIKALAYYPSGTHFVSAGSDKTVRCWNATTRAVIWSVNTDAIVGCLAVSPNGDSVVAGLDNGKIAVFESRIGKVESQIDAHSKAIYRLYFVEGNEKIGSEALDKLQRVHDVRTGVRRGSWGAHPLGKEYPWKWINTDFEVTGLWTPYLVIRQLGKNRPDTRRPSEADLEGHSAAIRTITYSPSGGFLLTGSDDMTVRMWNPRTAAVMAVFRGHTASVNAVAASPDGRFAISGGGDKTIRCWQLPTSN